MVKPLHSLLLAGVFLVLQNSAAEEQVNEAGDVMVHRFWDHISEVDPRLSVYLSNLGKHLNESRPVDSQLIFMIDASVQDRELSWIVQAKRLIEEIEKDTDANFGGGAGVTGRNLVFDSLLAELCARSGLTYRIDKNTVMVGDG